MNETGKPLGCLDAIMTVGRPRQLILCRDTRIPLDKIMLMSMDIMSEHRLRANKKSIVPKSQNYSRARGLAGSKRCGLP